jgi:hypothetical protein
MKRPILLNIEIADPTGKPFVSTSETRLERAKDWPAAAVVEAFRRVASHAPDWKTEEGKA